MVAVECGGVAFKCFTSMQTQKHIARIGETVTVYTHLNVREDALDLFGFSSNSELNCFKMLTGISGVGPKVALAILSEMSPEAVAMCAASGDSKSFTRANGVGPKLAQRIVLELKDKVGALQTSGDFEIPAGPVSAAGNAAEAVNALTVLGFSASEASAAVGKLDSALPVNELVRQALKNLARKG
jgi:Holliday junction DNA helicase RuvA